MSRTAGNGLHVQHFHADTEPRTALKNGDGYVEIMMDTKNLPRHPSAGRHRTQDTGNYPGSHSARDALHRG